MPQTQGALVVNQHRQFLLFPRKEGDGYDVTLPLHVSGKTIGIIGMDFKLDQKESGLVDRASVIAKEVEDQIPAKSKLFEAAK